MSGLVSGHPTKRLSLLAALLLLSACGGLETGNGQTPEPPPEPETAEVMLALGLADMATPLDIVDAGGATVVLDSAELVVDELRVDLDRRGEPVDCLTLERASGVDLDCGADNRLSVPGPITALLLEQRWSPSLGTLNLPAGSYKAVRATVTGLSLAGQVTVAGRALAFSLPVDMTHMLMFRQDDGIEAAAGDKLTLTLHVDMQQLFEDVDLGACVQQQFDRTGANPVVVDASQGCGQVRARLMTALDEAAYLD